jgi:hypothetical protein
VPPVFARKYGQSVTGGFVDRANSKSSFYGAYIFGDDQHKRRFALTHEAASSIKSRLLANAPQSVVSFGQDAAGEIYAAGYEGNVYELELDSSPFEQRRSGGPAPLCRYGAASFVEDFQNRMVANVKVTSVGVTSSLPGCVGLQH